MDNQNAVDSPSDSWVGGYLTVPWVNIDWSSKVRCTDDDTGMPIMLFSLSTLYTARFVPKPRHKG
jgi:hypothetical protein